MYNNQPSTIHISVLAEYLHSLNSYTEWNEVGASERKIWNAEAKGLLAKKIYMVRLEGGYAKTYTIIHNGEEKANISR